MAYDLVVVCGGTGGHVYPALAIAETLRKNHPEKRILFIVKKNGFEEKIMIEAGFDYASIRVEGFSRVRLLLNFRLLYIMPLSLVQAFRILLRSKSKAVLSTGGYTGVPVLASAVLLGKTIFLQEQNTFPGVTVRFFSRFARTAFLAYREADQYLPKKCPTLETGNPIRIKTGLAERQLRQEMAVDEKSKVVFVFGGSQGSRPINRMIAAILPELQQAGITLLWQSGKVNAEEVRKTAAGKSGVHVFTYIENIYDFYRASDLAVCRAGAMTLAELARFNLPAILIPLPDSAGDHQMKNARIVEQHGAGLCLPQEIAPKRLLEMILKMVNDKEKLGSMRSAMGQLYREDASTRIVERMVKEMAS